MAEPSGSTVVLRTIAALEPLDEPALMAHLFGVIYATAMRTGLSPRSILDTAFTAVPDDERWRAKTGPYLSLTLEK